MCAVAGIALLAGPGWALLVAAALLYTAPRLNEVPAGVRLVWARAQIHGRAARVWLTTPGRQRKAAAAMPVAVLGLAVGLAVAVGVGWGITAASLAVGGLSLAADRAG